MMEEQRTRKDDDEEDYESTLMSDSQTYLVFLPYQISIKFREYINFNLTFSNMFFSLHSR